MIQVRKALEAYKKKALAAKIITLKEGEETILDYIDYLCMHLPYSNMGKKALSYLVRHEWRKLPRWKKLIEKIGVPEPVPKDPRGTIESILADRTYMEKDHEFQKLFTKTEEFQKIYEQKLASSLIASTMVGNLYTASLYLGFRSTLEFEYKNGIDLNGKRFGFGSYGSGSSAMVFSGVIQPQYEQVVKDMDMESEISPRKKLSIQEYEELHENKRSVQEALLETKNEFVLIDVKTNPESKGERKYVFNE
jgi:hydroxymethylglutaryl-CoA synthase